MTWAKDAKAGDKVTCVKGSAWSKCEGVNLHNLTDNPAPKVGDVCTVVKVHVFKGIEFFTLEGFDELDRFCSLGFRPKAAAKIKEAA